MVDGDMPSSPDDKFVPNYWQVLKEYIEEAEHEGQVPEDFYDWVKDFTMYMEHLEDDTRIEIWRVKVMTPDENDLMGNALYGLMEINEDVVEGDKGAVDYDEEVAYNAAFREIVEREWIIEEPIDRTLLDPETNPDLPMGEPAVFGNGPSGSIN